MPTSTLFMVVEKEKKKSYIDLNHQIFTWGKWCYDTPGTINHDQVCGEEVSKQKNNSSPMSKI